MHSDTTHRTRLYQKTRRQRCMYYVKYVFAASGGWEERRKKPSTKTTVQGQHKAVKAAQQQPVRRAAQRKDNIDFQRHYFGLF